MNANNQLVIMWYDEQPNEQHIVVRKELIGEQIERAANKYIAAIKWAGKREKAAFIAGVSPAVLWGRGRVRATELCATRLQAVEPRVVRGTDGGCCYIKRTARYEREREGKSAGDDSRKNKISKKIKVKFAGPK